MKATLWLIEDDPLWAELVSAKLSEKFTIQHFPTVSAAIEAARTGSLPKYILLDYHLPDKPGIELLKALKKHENPDHPPYVIMLSAQEDVQTAADTFTYGAYDYVVKGDHVWERLKIAFRNIGKQEALRSEVIELRVRVRRSQILVGAIVLLAAMLMLAIYVQLCPDNRLWKWDPLGVGQKPPCAPIQ
ncbi:MAG: response regulator [Bacteroidia bacterium]|nr:response regulator [Bacteroidia bacterium]MCX7651451.1 response regulator [Bacteroidia bacterium]MDW8416794.1 response regulator [Bacteroidia bacterium]